MGLKVGVGRPHSQEWRRNTFYKLLTIYYKHYIKKITLSDKAGTFDHWGNDVLFTKWCWNALPVICMTNYSSSYIIQHPSKFHTDYRLKYTNKTIKY